MFTALKPFGDRVESGLTAEKITADLRRRLSAIKGAVIITLAPPPVRGIGTAGGFKMLVQDKRGRGPAALEAAVQDLIGAANKTEGLIELALAIILIVPMCLLAAVTGLLIRGMNIDILAQIGFVVLVGLAAKNAILIVEFAKQSEEGGANPLAAAMKAARTRLRPILTTSLAFIFGVIPLAIATGAGSEMRQVLGTAMFFGMLGVTVFGLLFTPMFYVVVRRAFGGRTSIVSLKALIVTQGVVRPEHA